MKKGDNFFVIIFSFLFPLMLIGWGIRESLTKSQKKVETEGLLFNLIFLFALIFLKYLSLIPILGIVFSFLFTIFLWFYVLAFVVIVIIKSNDIEKELPFISFYAERLMGK
ncbi:hypothetical protein TTHT_0139 [Thermotomaculum hydrothermale]|uniref:Uncharacterized protein n=1 Tax=Thermotomaculum hydrothermale TaxID=981385 RepID=A0A7R6PSG1_9BACT|nr:hypothetical protein [Thermotomaculum hydrothermale]BBB31782.1 hypothetical protein TTHT_0139 [Thermotomaculum hydrothermale]